MDYTTKKARQDAGLCVDCENTAVVANHRCQGCSRRYVLTMRERTRAAGQCAPRSIWSPEQQKLVTIDDAAAYDALRAQVAVEMAGGAKGSQIAAKYKMSWWRVRKICVEHGVAMVHKRGCGEHKKAPADRAAKSGEMGVSQ